MAFQQADHNHGKENDNEISTIELYKYDMTYKRYKPKKKRKHPLRGLRHVTMKAVFKTYERNVSTASTESVDLKKEPSQRDKHLFSYTLRRHDPRALPRLCNYNVELTLCGGGETLLFLFFFLISFRLQIVLEKKGTVQVQILYVFTLS